MSLYLDYRPREFAEVLGNKETIKAIQSILTREPAKIPHAFLLTGPSGCGKTTMARLIAKELGCSDDDLRELDTAHFRGIDTIRELRQTMNYLPSGGSKCRVWILDETHQLSRDAMSALLKALEDTPGHAYFMLCTTDPEKLLPTIRNRCTTFAMQALTEKQIKALIAWVCREENFSIPPEVADQITNDCMGSARAALVVLDKIRDMTEDDMLAAAQQAAAEENEAIALCRLLMKKNVEWKEVAALLPGLKQEPETIRRTVLGYFSKVLLAMNDSRLYIVLKAFEKHYYDIGKPGLVVSCYEACMALTRK